MAERDIEYFAKLWEDSKPKDGMVHNKDTWDRLAKNWGNDSPKVKLKKDEKVYLMRDYLIEKGALGEDTEMLDLGCGPGQFGLVFAKTAKFVTLSDVSTVMLDYAKNNAVKEELTNVDFAEADFLKQSVEELGWEKKYDLVFTSMTPAMDNVDSIRKINQVTRKWAFNNSFVYLHDSLKDEVKQNVFGMPTTNVFGDSSPYSIWNILWQMGCCPTMEYYSNEIHYEYDLCRQTAFETVENIIRDRGPNDDEVDEVLKYFEKRFPDGKVIRDTESLFSWILWKVD